jgi:hypothetical protein
MVVSRHRRNKLSGLSHMLSPLDQSIASAKDRTGISLDAHRTSVLQVLDAAWQQPDSQERVTEALASLQLAFEGFRAAKLIAWPPGFKRHRLLRCFTETPERLREFCKANPVPLREILALHLLLKGAFTDAANESGDSLAVLDVLLHRDEDKLFVPEIRHRFRAARFVQVMAWLGFIHAARPAKLTDERRKRIAALMAAPDPEMARYLPAKLRGAYGILENALRLQAVSSTPEPERLTRKLPAPADVFGKLRDQLTALCDGGLTETSRCRRLISFGLGAIVRSMSAAEDGLGRKMYAFLRSGKRMPKISHGAMFRCICDERSRLALLNFLWAGATRQDAEFFLKKFSPYFTAARLRFVESTNGFAL